MMKAPVPESKPAISAVSGRTMLLASMEIQRMIAKLSTEAVARSNKFMLSAPSQVLKVGGGGRSYYLGLHFGSKKERISLINPVQALILKQKWQKEKGQ